MSNYSLLEKLLHRQFLGKGQISEFLFERLLIKSQNKTINHNYEYVFVLGLARSGTTALLNKIYQSNQFGSFLYSHMPFILSPRLANYFSSKYKNEDKAVIRYHNDGLLINKNSPECLDEVYWIKSNDNYFDKSYIEKEDINFPLLKGYDQLISEYCKFQNKKRFVVKNNNNHMRIVELANFFKSSKFLIMFRDPIAHARSLLNQHLNFINLQNKDDFILEYMNLIGHREFGKNAKPFIYEGRDIFWYKGLNNRSLLYWLSQWIATYSWLYSSLKDLDNIYLICYENLCSKKESSYELTNLLNIDNNDLEFKIGKSSFNKKNTDIKPNLINKANEIYDALKNKSFI